MSLCSTMSPNVKIYAFELMNNHIHCVVRGEEGGVVCFFKEYKRLLKKYCDGVENMLDWDRFTPHLCIIETLDNLRNVIAYVHRNGAMAYPKYSPVSYPWGTNTLFFNPDIMYAHKKSTEKILWADIRIISHSHKFDKICNVPAFNGIASMVNVCAIEEGESFFRDARQYFFKISRDVERYREIAGMIGESVCYTDDELFSIAIRLSAEKYGEAKLSVLAPSAKMELARRLRYEYNAGFKQLQRILHLGESTLMSMFPSDRT